MSDDPDDVDFGRPIDEARAELDPAGARFYGVLVDALRAAYAERLLSVKLVGSRARGTATPNSDHDLLVFLDRCDYAVEVPRLAELAAQLTAAHGFGPLSLSPMTTAQFRGLDAKYAGITAEFRRDAIALWTASV